MKASDIMVSDVITVRPDVCVQEVADILLRNRISAVPVVGPDGELQGIVSEGDLVRRPEIGTQARRPWWLEALTSNEALAAEYAKTHGQRVADVMTRNVITAAPDTPVSDVAALLEKNGIKRVPIVKDGKVIGIVSRANLLQAFASLAKEKALQAAPDDTALRDKVMAQLKAQRWTRPSLLNVIVKDGTVDLWGIVDSQAEKQAVRVLAEATPGVRAVNDNLIIRPAVSEG